MARGAQSFTGEAQGHITLTVSSPVVSGERGEEEEEEEEERDGLEGSGGKCES